MSAAAYAVSFDIGADADGMGFDEADDRVSRLETKFVHGFGRDFHRQAFADVHVDKLFAADGGDVQEAAFDGVADAETLRLLSAEDDIVSPDADEDPTAWGAVAERDLQLPVPVADTGDALRGVVGDDVHWQHVFEAVRLHKREDFGLLGDIEEVAAGKDATLPQDDDLAGELEDFGDGVADIEHGDGKVGADMAQVRNDAVFESLVQ